MPFADTKGRRQPISLGRSGFELCADRGQSGHTPFLGCLAQTSRCSRRSFKVCRLTAGCESSSPWKSHSNLCTEQACFSLENLSVGVGPASHIPLLPFPSGSRATFPSCCTFPYTTSWPEVPDSSLLHSSLMQVGDMLGSVVSRKLFSPVDSRESIQFHEHCLSDPVNLE